MTPGTASFHTAFLGPRRLAAGPLHEVAVAVAKAAPGEDLPLVFSDASGAQVDLDLRGTAGDIAARYAPVPAEEPAPRTRGRPKLGVVAREVTLLPEHWDWLAAQPGGASVALRKLVHEAMRAGTGRQRLRRAQERSYRVMVVLAGDRPGFEEAARALFAGDTARLGELAGKWPRDVRDYVLRLADPDHDPTAAPAAP